MCPLDWDQIIFVNSLKQSIKRLFFLWFSADASLTEGGSLFYIGNNKRKHRPSVQDDGVPSRFADA